MVELRAIVDYIGINPDCNYNFVKDQSPDWIYDNEVAFEVTIAQPPEDLLMMGNDGPSGKKLREVIDKDYGVLYYPILECKERKEGIHGKKNQYVVQCYRYDSTSKSVEINGEWRLLSSLPIDLQSKFLDARIKVGKPLSQSPLNSLLSSFDDKIKDINDPNYRSFRKYVLWVYHSLGVCDSRFIASTLEHMMDAQSKMTRGFDEIYFTAAEGIYLFEPGKGRVSIIETMRTCNSQCNDILRERRGSLHGCCLHDLIKNIPSIRISKGVLLDFNAHE